MQTPTLTTKQTDIILLLYRFRFLDRIDIQTYFNHKTFSRINSWLSELTNQQYLGRIYSTDFKDKTKPATYYLNTKSRLLLKNKKGIDNNLINRIYREKKRSKTFIEHCQLVAKIYFYLSSLAEKSHAKLHFYTKTDLSSFDYLLDTLPDAYLAIDEKGNTKRYFIEIFDERKPRFILRKRIEQYFDYADSKEWEETTKHPFPTIIFICPNQFTKDFLLRYLKSLSEEQESDISIYLGLKSEIQQGGLSKEVLQKVESD